MRTELKRSRHEVDMEGSCSLVDGVAEQLAGVRERQITML